MGIRLLIFLDNILTMADSLERAAKAHRNGDKGLGISRLRDKEKVVNLEANPDYPISRFHCKFDKDAPSIARRKTAKIKVICSISSRKCAHSHRNFKFLGSVPGSYASFANGSLPLQGYSERLDSGNFSTRRQGKLQKNYKSIRGRNQGSTLVDSRFCTSKWQDDYSSKGGFSNFLRCFKDQIGSSSSRNQHRRSLERARSPKPYKLLGSGSSISGSQSYFASDKGKSCPVWPGQSHCSSLHQLAGRYKISTPHSIDTRHMVLRSRQEHGDISNSCSRKMESHSRWKVQNLSRFDSMDARSQSVQRDNQTSGTPSCGSVCLSGKSSDTRVCVMEARTRGNSNRCFQYPLGLSTELPVSSFLPDTNVPKESNAGAGRPYSHCSSMEELAMKSSTPIHAYRVSSVIASGSENPEALRDRQDSPLLLPKEIPVS